jgi:hypothetical protein
MKNERVLAVPVRLARRSWGGTSSDGVAHCADAGTVLSQTAGVYSDIFPRRRGAFHCQRLFSVLRPTATFDVYYLNMTTLCMPPGEIKIHGCF